ncbi:MAG TPA: hypothetical protein VNT22_08600 [Baekduia sp.]|nr:hypothetical protein [Baekduia sp.]
MPRTQESRVGVDTERVTGCPVAHELRPFDATYLEDPYKIFATLRERGPVHYSPELDMWVVTRYADVETVFKSPAEYSGAIAQSPVTPLTAEATRILTAPDGPEAVMSNRDPPAHTRIHGRLHQRSAPLPARRS